MLDRFRHAVLPITLAALLPLGPGHDELPSAARWWDIGHRIVALIAEERLTPHTREAVRDILEGQSLPDASVWADNIRQYRHDADKLHYVNIELRDTAYVPERDCPAGRCIIAAIERDRRILESPASSPTERAEALRFLIHFVGDLHQPLHVADDSDRGGNQTTVYLLGHSTNLHRVWDGELIQRFGLTDSAYLAELHREMDTLDLAALERGTVVDWALEGHRVAVARAYRVHRGGRLGQAYLDASRPLVDRALIEAGVRLARVLNEALVAYQPPSAGAVPR